MILTPHREQESLYPWGIFYSQGGNFGSCKSEHSYEIYISQNWIHAVSVGAPTQCFLIMLPLSIDFFLWSCRANLLLPHLTCYVMYPRHYCAAWATKMSLCPFFYLCSGWLHSSPQSVVQPSASKSKRKVTCSWCLFFKKSRRLGCYTTDCTCILRTYTVCILVCFNPMGSNVYAKVIINTRMALKL